jgi:uncharacterized membrane protein YcaP (DUF421 family)
MLTLLIRTVLTYIFLIFIMRLMGKRQLGELEITDLVITLLLSEIATVALTDTSKSLLHTIIPVFTLALLEMSTSWLALKVPKFQKLLSPKPTILIHNGKIDRKQMQKARVSLDELMCELRQKEISDIEQVQYAIMESSGKISVIKKAADSPPTAAQLGMQPCEPGMMRAVFCDGIYADKTLRAIGRDRNWVNKQIRQHNLTPDAVFFVTADDNGNVRIQQK